MGSRRKTVGTVAELFAGVGGFRCGLEPSGWDVVWSNQWEPATKAQHASDCYSRRFPHDKRHICEDIEKIVNVPNFERRIPRIDLLVGGFPCQDYSVAKPLPQATGIRGKKGVLWWSIYAFLEAKKPKYVLLENVDRLLKSPANQRGRDFAVILSCFARLGYGVEWRVINAADYGFPQRRRRVFIYAERRPSKRDWEKVETQTLRINKSGVLARAFPVLPDESPEQFVIQDAPPVSVRQFEIADDPYVVSENFGSGGSSPFENAGIMYKGHVSTRKVAPQWEGRPETLGDIVARTPAGSVDESFYISKESEKSWAYLKGPKQEERVDKKTGFKYRYSEGGVGFPDALNKPSRTILTGEGGSSPSRFKHVIRDPNDGRLRRLIPEELEELNGFPRGWTEGMSDAKRAFMMGNALVVGVVERIGRVLAQDVKAKKRARAAAKAKRDAKENSGPKPTTKPRSGREAA